MEITLKLHDAKVEKPKEHEFYVTFKEHVRDDGESRYEYLSINELLYVPEHDGWNVHVKDGERLYEQFPDYWAEKPTLEEYRALKGEANV